MLLTDNPLIQAEWKTQLRNVQAIANLRQIYKVKAREGLRPNPFHQDKNPREIIGLNDPADEGASYPIGS